MPHEKKTKVAIKQTPDPVLNKMMEELIALQEEEKARNSFSQRVGKTGTFTWNVISQKSSWTREFEALYGFPNGNFKGGTFENWSKLIHPRDRKRVHEETLHALTDTTREELNVEFRIVWPDKSIHYLLTRARIIRNAQGQAVEVSGVNIDITERKQLETNLQYLAEASKILASSLDYHETLKTVAKLGVPEISDWCAVDMFTEQNEIKRLAVAHVDPKKIKWAWELAKKNPPNINNQTGLAQVLRSGKSEFYPVITDEMLVAAAKDEEDLKIIRKVKFSSVMIVPLIVEGRPIGAITFVHSESNRHFTKADLTIAEEVASRAALAIHNARLFTDSQNAISIRDEFISVASHELKTPVTSLKMYTQIIQKQLALRGETILLAPLSKMNTQIDKLTLLINDLLNISRIQLGKLEFNEEYFNLQDIVEDTVDSVQASTQTHTIHLKGSIHKKVWGDKDRISQVITNLLTNAIKYSPHANSVEIKIHAGKKMAEVCVCDYGIGIEEEQQKKIFNRFYRVVGAEEKTFPGLGIGLYISAEIIRRHGGDISVKSKKGKGSTFIITLPYKKTK